MSKQELPNQSETLDDVNLSKRRRFIVGAVPVVLTLASPTVFGAECLSQQMSGNISQNPGNCVAATGQDPAYWAAQSVWPTYDKATVSIGVLLNSGETGLALTALDPVTTTSRFIAAKLNAISISNYILTSAQVDALWSNPASYPPGYPTVDSFLESTWAY
jgi:hypothetical protein